MARHLLIDPLRPEAEFIAAARAALDSGAVIALPTDTLYGLAANATDAAAVARVFEIKGRGWGQPLPLLVRDVAQAERIAPLPPLFYRLAAAFWPGALTLVVPLGAGGPMPPDAILLPELLAGAAAGLRTIGLRQSSSPIAAAVLAAAGYPLTATSANRSGGPECSDAAQVEAQLGPQLGLIVDGGPAPGGAASTVVDLSGPVPRILRHGAVPAACLMPYWK